VLSSFGSKTHNRNAGHRKNGTWIFGKTVPKEDHISSNTGCKNKTSTGEWGVRFYGDTIGHDGIREAAVLLAGHLPKAAIPTARRMVEGEFACLEWRGDAAHAVVRDGVDSFVIRDGFIVGMTAYYSVASRYGGLVVALFRKNQFAHTELSGQRAFNEIGI
jgi:hypothetical protein